MSKIEWTNETWNPIVGCSIVSPGCTNCYAMKMAARLEAMAGAGLDDNGYAVRGTGALDHYRGLTKVVNGKPVWTGKLARAPEATLLAPLRRKKPTTYFVNSMSDLFHENVPTQWIDEIFAVMALAPQHTFQVLTKRSARMQQFMTAPRADQVIPGPATAIIERARKISGTLWNMTEWPLPNVWLGVSAEDQDRASQRIPDLLETPAAVRFVSAEPLLGPINFTPWLMGHEEPGLVGNCIGWTPPLDWVIVGGESGSGARPLYTEWVRSIVAQCQREDVACFVKQLGAKARDGGPELWKPKALKHKKGADMAEWPEPLRVRQFPGYSKYDRAPSGQAPSGKVMA